jgi:hemolysin III
LSERIESNFEKKLNYQTHGFGLLLSLLGTFFLINKSLIYPSDEKLFSSIIYGFSLIFMFGSSTIYHYFIDTKYSYFLQKIDHISIYFLIAGSYTPPLILKLGHSMGNEILVIIWFMAITGIIHKIFFFKYFEKATLIIYLIMGWLIIIDFGAVLNSFSEIAITLMVIGGLMYTIGTIFYSMDNLKFNHVIWHFFVLAGAFCHFLMMNTII